MENISVYQCKDGRTRVYLKDTKKVISYPKYLMEQSLGRKLRPEEQVHHKDEHPLNNNLDNLEVVKLGEHQRHHSTKYVDRIAKCAWCGKEFLWTAKQQKRFYGSKKRRLPDSDSPFCSKSCSGSKGRSIQMSQVLH